MSQPTVLLFDFGGTLDADGDRWAVRFHSAYAAAGGRLGLREFEALFRESDRQLERDPAVQTMGFRAMTMAQVDLLRPLLPDGSSVHLGGVAERFHRDSLAMVERNRKTLEWLRDRYRLGVVSNFTGNLDRCLTELDLLRYFSATADSLLLGWAKPDPRIFQWTLEILQTEPSTAWMVGDNFENDIRPAAALGLGTCWLAHPDRPSPSQSLGCGRIAQLTDLPAFLHTCMD
jgi:putative hydrolase of the HAD superfamily